jgi:hypothetical protein
MMEIINLSSFMCGLVLVLFGGGAGALILYQAYTDHLGMVGIGWVFAGICFIAGFGVGGIFITLGVLGNFT